MKTTPINPSPDAGETPESQRSSAPAGSPVRAFRVVTDYFNPPVATIIRTTSAARAKYKCWDAAHSAGYPIEWKTLKVCRAPEFDGAKLIKDRPYREEFAKKMIQENDQIHPRRA